MEYESRKFRVSVELLFKPGNRYNQYFDYAGWTVIVFHKEELQLFEPPECWHIIDNAK